MDTNMHLRARRTYETDIRSPRNRGYMKSRSIRMTLLLAMVLLFAGISIPLWGKGGTPHTNNRPILGAREANALIVTVVTPKELRTLALYLNQDAEQFEAEARAYEGTIEAYRKTPTAAVSGNAGGVGTIEDCELFANSYREMAGAYRVMAGTYEEMASQESKK